MILRVVENHGFNRNVALLKSLAGRAYNGIMNTSRPMTKSPRAVAQEAARSREVLPAYSSKFSRKDFTQHQLFAALALKTFFKTDYRGVVRLLADFAELREDLGPGRGAPTISTLCYAAKRLLKKGRSSYSSSAPPCAPQEGGLIGAKPTAAIDATGMESRHTSRYFFKRAGRKHNSRLWTKLAVACDTASHFFTAATVSLGPANDAPQFRPLMAQASLAVGYDRVLGDAAFDGEESHRYCREDLGVRSTVIPINRRNGGRKWPKTRYRRQMGQAVPQEAAGQPAQARLRAALAGGERLLPTQAAARLGAAGQVGCVARTRVLPAGTHPQPHAPRRYRLEDFNRAP